MTSHRILLHCDGTFGCDCPQQRKKTHERKVADSLRQKRYRDRKKKSQQGLA